MHSFGAGFFVSINLTGAIIPISWLSGLFLSIYSSSTPVLPAKIYFRLNLNNWHSY
jgi:hypothetical protein